MINDIQVVTPRLHRNFFLFPVSRPTHFLEKIIFFLPNTPPLFQLVALFLAVSVLGMCSQTTDSCISMSLLANYRQHLYTIKVWSEMSVLHRRSTSGGHWVVSHGQNFKVKKQILNRLTGPVFFHLGDQKVWPKVVCCFRLFSLSPTLCFNFFLTWQWEHIKESWK